MVRSLDAQQQRVLSQIDLSPCNGCDECGLRCAAGVRMSREEYERVCEFERSADCGSRVEEVRRQAKNLDLGDGVEVVMCRYRDIERGECAVYPVRPLVCRLLGHVEWMPCPIGKVERRARTEDALELMGVYARRRLKTFAEWEHDTKERP